MDSSLHCMTFWVKYSMKLYWKWGQYYITRCMGVNTTLSQLILFSKIYPQSFQVTRTAKKTFGVQGKIRKWGLHMWVTHYAFIIMNFNVEPLFISNVCIRPGKFFCTIMMLVIFARMSRYRMFWKNSLAQ